MFLSKLPSEWQNDRVRYLDLYCRTQLYCGSKNEAVPGGDSREIATQQMLRFAEEWGRLNCPNRCRKQPI